MTIVRYFTYSIFLLLFSAFIYPDNESVKKPSLLLANIHQKDIDLKNYWVSEKLDGVRAYWDGSQLVSRQGITFNAPKWFVANFPQSPLDGELWLGRGRFDELSGIVRKHRPNDTQWRLVKYMIFDLPNDPSFFTDRLNQLKQIIPALNITWLKVISQWKVENHHHLMQQLQHYTAQGAEGLMLHRADSYYHGVRSNDLLKLKVKQNSEATVIGHLRGKGKLKGLLGAIKVQTNDGRIFKIGTGFSLSERLFPPPVGSIITFQYNGLTSKGLPRFSRYLRMKSISKPNTK